MSITLMKGMAMKKLSSDQEHNIYMADNIVREPEEFLMELIKEYEEKIMVLENRITETKADSLSLKDELNVLLKERKDTSKLFSPNARQRDSGGLNDRLVDQEKHLNELITERKRYQKAILGLQEASRILKLSNEIKRSKGLDIIKFQEQERQRIARDLHDSTVQNLTGLIHKLELCTRMIDMDPIRAKLELAAMTVAVKSSINEIRDIIYNLKPMMLDDLGFSTTIERYAKQIMANHNIEVFVKCGELQEELPAVIRVSVLRVIQEACNNVIKHAKATRIDINMDKKGKDFIVTIKDNGMGFNVDMQKGLNPEGKSGYGLSIMKERINMLSGTMSINSNKPSGTVISFTVPIINYGGDNDE
jgi:two-component system sensor histidine kinase DegS